MSMMQVATHRPQKLAVDREASLLRIHWVDGHASDFRLAWLRAVCPCATCAEAKRTADADPLQLVVGPGPSAAVTGAELVGNYALRIIWADGHDGGIYGFSGLRASCPCAECGGIEPDHLRVE